MRKTLFLMLTFLPLICFGQEEQCFKSKKEIQKHLEGVWKEKDINNKSLFEYSFIKRGKGYLLEIEKTTTSDEYAIIDDHTIFEVLRHKKKFKIKYTYLHGNWTSEIKFLNSIKMILLTDGEEVEYIKVKK